MFHIFEVFVINVSALSCQDNCLRYIHSWESGIVIGFAMYIYTLE